MPENSGLDCDSLLCFVNSISYQFQFFIDSKIVIAFEFKQFLFSNKFQLYLLLKIRLYELNPKLIIGTTSAITKGICNDERDLRNQLVDDII